LHLYRYDVISGLSDKADKTVWVIHIEFEELVFIKMRRLAAIGIPSTADKTRDGDGRGHNSFL
jgi:hypothetical protein